MKTRLNFKKKLRFYQRARKYSLFLLLENLLLLIENGFTTSQAVVGGDSTNSCGNYFMIIIINHNQNDLLEKFKDQSTVPVCYYGAIIWYFIIHSNFYDLF